MFRFLVNIIQINIQNERKVGGNEGGDVTDLKNLSLTLNLDEKVSVT